MTAGVVFWDFDGTLARREGMWRSCLLTALDAISPDHELTDDDIRPGLRDGFPWHRPDAPHPELSDSADAWWQALNPLLVRTYRRAGVAAPTASAAAALVRTTYIEPEFWQVYSDVHAALKSLRRRGWRHIVLSNHVPELPQLVDALGLGGLVDDVITSARVGYEKPHPDIFAYARRGFAASVPLWMVGDNPIADVQGATSVGIDAILVRDSADHDLGWAALQIAG